MPALSNIHTPLAKQVNYGNRCGAKNRTDLRIFHFYIFPEDSWAWAQLGCTTRQSLKLQPISSSLHPSKEYPW